MDTQEGLRVSWVVGEDHRGADECGWLERRLRCPGKESAR